MIQTTKIVLIVCLFSVCLGASNEKSAVRGNRERKLGGCTIPDTCLDPANIQTVLTGITGLGCSDLVLKVLSSCTPACSQPCLKCLAGAVCPLLPSLPPTVESITELLSDLLPGYLSFLISLVICPNKCLTSLVII